MPTYLLYRKTEDSRNEKGLHSVIVNAADLATAITLADGKAPWGTPYEDWSINSTLRGTKGIAKWGALDLSTVAANSVTWIQGDVVSLLGIDRGGNKFP